MSHTSLISSPVMLTRNLEASAKRVFDIAASAAALLMLLPLLLGISILILARDPGPILFRHRRIGKDGRVFFCLKFRTMVHDADKALADLLASDEAARAEWEAHRKLPHDPRILGRLGRWLRATGLDELPQLWNILRGDMSFVGPRPVTVEELGYYGPSLSAYFSLRPGLTGKWQVLRRRDTTFAERVRMDVDYVRTRGFFTDLLIILVTPIALITSNATT